MTEIQATAQPSDIENAGEPISESLGGFELAGQFKTARNPGYGAAI